MRLRSSSTLVAIAFILITTAIWIPDPSSGDSSISWIRSTDGVRVSGAYNVGYLGAASAILWSVLVGLVGFYLVTGAVRRDTTTRVGIVVAATPVSRGGYLCGLFLAHVAFLLLLTGIAITVSVITFARYGDGAFSFWPFVLPTVLLCAPSIAFTAALAVLFDVHPATSQRGGHILYFFVWLLLVGVVPSLLHQGIGPATRIPASDVALFDPGGYATLSGAIYRTVPDAQPGTLAMGRQSGMRIDRTDWSGLPMSPQLVAARIAAVLWAIPVLVLATRGFERFDPARRAPVADGRPTRRRASVPSALRRAATELEARLRPIAAARTRGRAARGMLAALDAEVRLLWQLASPIRWPWLIASITAVAYPAPTVVNAFLILCAPLVAEAAALEHIHGTRTVVRSQPATGRPRVLWTLSAVTVLLLLGGAPALFGIAVRSLCAALTFGTALVFIAAFSVSAGTVTRGGKLFLATYTLLWYAAASTGTSALDFMAVFRPAVQWSTAGMHMTLSALSVAVALIIDARRSDG